MRKRGLFVWLVLVAACVAIHFQAQTLTITSPTDQAWLDLSNGEFFNVSWTCDQNVTELELWVNGQSYCSYCGGGYSGTISGVDSWTNPPFYDQCWHILQLKALIGGSFYYSAPVLIHDLTYFGASPCPPPPSCAISTMGGPVDVATGKMTYDQEDLRIDGPLPMAFSRRYAHRTRTTLGGFGYGWTHSYNLSLANMGGGKLFRTAEGRDVLFPVNISGGYVYNQRDRMTLASIAGGFRVTAKDQTNYNFNSAGRLTSIVDRNGNTLTMVYDGSNRLSTITDGFGRAFTLGYNASSRITSLTDGTRTVTYGYTDGQNNLNSATYPSAQTWTYAYGATPANHRPETISDPLGHVVEAITYNGSDKVATWSRQSGAEQLTFTYTSSTQTSVTNSLGAVTTFTLKAYDGVATTITGPGCSSCGSGTNESYLLDAYFNKTQITDGNGNITKQTFDSYGDVLTRTEAFGTALQRVTTYTYNPTYHFVATATAPSVDTGGQNRLETLGYDAANGNLLTDTLSGYSNGIPFTRTTTYTYNAHGLVLTQDGPRSDVSDMTTYAYYLDSDPDATKKGRLQTVTNALGHVTTINGYTLSGKAAVTVDPNGVERDDCYDDLDRLCGVTVKGPTPSDDLATNYTLNADGLPDSVTLPNGNVITYTRDALHRLTEVTDQAGNKTVYFYDTESRRTREEFRDPSATVTRFTNFKYDNYNRLQYVYYNATVPPGAGSVYWEYAYDNAGNRKSVKDPLGHLTCFEHDALNRKMKTHQYLGTAPATCLGTCTSPGCTDLVSQYGYDPQDHTTSVTDPGGLVTTYSVDDAAQVWRQVSPDTGTTNYTYDTAANLSTRTDAVGAVETRTYDALNRLTALTYPDTSNNVAYIFDDPTATNGIGRRTATTDPAGTTIYSYDFTGRLVQENRTPMGQSNAFTQYAWDKNGNLTGLTYPSGRIAAFTINTSDQVTAAVAVVNGTSTTIASSIAYAPFGPHTAMAFGNGLADARSFDSRYRLGTWTLGGLISKTYTWQDDDNITGITDNLNAANNRTFGYAAIHRLTSPVTGPWGTGSYTYDANGNRIAKVEGAISTSYTCTAGTNRLATATGSEPATYGYDANGNTTSDGSHTYQFSQRDRLATVDSGATATYSYDGDGRRVKKVVGGIATHYFYDPEGKLLEEYIPATGAGKDYVWMPDTYEPLARVDFGLVETDNGNVLRVTKSSPNVHLDWSLDGTTGPFVMKRSLSFTFSSPAYLGPAQAAKTFDDAVLGNGTNYAYEAFRRVLTDTLYLYHADHLGMPIAMTDTSGTLVWRAEQNPFGGIYALTVGTVPNNLRFPGQYYDSETGLAQNYFRDYRASIGRYWEADSLGTDSDLNLFEYSYSNPMFFSDPLGLFRICFTKLMLVTAYSDRGPGSDWPHFKPRKRGGVPTSVGPGDVAVANTSPPAFPYGSTVTVYGPTGTSVYDGEVHDTGAGWNPEHHNVPPGLWLDIWLPYKEAKRWGKQWRQVRICFEACEVPNPESR